MISLPVPDLYRGPHRETDPAAVMKYFCEAKALLEARVAGGRKLAALLMEPIFTFHGMTVAEPLYMQVPQHMLYTLAHNELVVQSIPCATLVTLVTLFFSAGIGKICAKSECLGDSGRGTGRTGQDGDGLELPTSR